MKAEIIAVLDRSGSMASAMSDVIGGYNSLIEKQRAENVPTNVTLVIFDDQIEFVYEGLDISEVKELTSADIYARNMTALNDAVGQAISKAGHRFAGMPEEDRPHKVVVFISTDGLENASREFTNDKIKQMVEHQREKYSWEFIFSGADIDAYEVGSRFSIPNSNILSYNKSKEGTEALYRSSTDKITRFTSGQVVDCSFTPEEKQEVEKHAKERS